MVLYPSDILDLSQVVLQVPVNNKDTTIKDLKDYENQYFYTSGNFKNSSSAALNYVIFKIYADSPTSSGSEFPRTELKFNQVINSKDKSKLQFSLSIEKLPVKNPEIVFCQIKTSSKELQLVIKGPIIYVRDFDVKHYPMLEGYILGTVLDCSLSIENNEIVISIGKSTLNLKTDFQEANFKLGNYMQSNIKMGEDKSTYSQISLFSFSE